MYYSLTGKIVFKDVSFFAIECSGVGYKCAATLKTLQDLPSLGAEFTVFTHLNVREDALELFGFSTTSELECYKMITSVSGVGPKVGIAILSALSAEQLTAAISSADVKVITSAPGVGPKLAQRIILELKDKIGVGVVERLEMGDGAQAYSTNTNEALSALVALGYNSSVANKALQGLDGGLAVEELIKIGLQNLAKGG